MLGYSESSRVLLGEEGGPRLTENNSPTLDMQQLATHARDASLMTADDIAISVVAEVASRRFSALDSGEKLTRTL